MPTPRYAKGYGSISPGHSRMLEIKLGSKARKGISQIQRRRYRPVPKAYLRRKLAGERAERRLALIEWRQQSSYWIEVQRDVIRRVHQAKSPRAQTLAFARAQRLRNLELISELELEGIAKRLQKIIGGR